MNYNFRLDKEKKCLIIEASLTARKKLKDPHIIINKSDVVDIVKQSFVEPDGWILDKCITDSSQYLDNYDLSRLSGTWMFNMQKVRSTKSKNQTSSRKKTTNSES